MKKILTISHCRECTHFIDTDPILRHWRETCRLTAEHVPWDDENNIFPIPETCPLPTADESMVESTDEEIIL